MTQILPNIFAVEVPDKSSSFELNNECELFLLPHPGHSVRKNWILLPPGSYKILFTTKDCTEDDASSVRNAVVDAHFDTELQEWRYGFHYNNTMIYENATDALKSLLRSHGLDPINKNYLLVSKIN